MDSKNIINVKDPPSSDSPTGETKESKENSKAKRAVKKDRSSGRFSEKDFLEMTRSEQFELAKKYWNGAVADFEDGTFQFSYSHLATLCKKLGFEKGIVDTKEDENNLSNPVGLKKQDSIIYINHGRREDTVEKKYTLTQSTINKLERLLKNKDGTDLLSNIEKSKVVDAIFSQALDQLLLEKDAGLFGVSYRQLEEERLI